MLRSIPAFLQCVKKESDNRAMKFREKKKEREKKEMSDWQENVATSRLCGYQIC